MNAPRNTFHKTERLCSKRLIDQLFAEGKSFYVSPVKVIYMSWPEESVPSLRLLISVPKRFFKKAVDRNRVKRLMREAWRTQKHPLFQQLDTDHQQYLVALVYTGKNLPGYEQLRATILLILQRLLRQYEEVSSRADDRAD